MFAAAGPAGANEPVFSSAMYSVSPLARIRIDCGAAKARSRIQESHGLSCQGPTQREKTLVQKSWSPLLEACAKISP
eukprot:4706486-Pyramimonas_sp.AAC.1